MHEGNGLPDHLKRLAKSSTIYGLGNLLPKAIGLILIPIYTRYLTPQDYGILAMVTVIHSVLLLLFDMGFSTSTLRFYFDFKEGPDLKRYLGTVTVFLLGFNLVFLVLLQSFGEPIFSFIIKDKSLSFSPYIKLGIYTAYFSLGSVIPLALFRVREQAAKYISFTTATFLLTTIAIIYFVVIARQGALGSLKGRLFVTMGFFAVYLWIMLRQSTLSID